MKNHLSNEASLYLRQHASNPVEWYSWGEAPFALAKRLNKPILISIGYSSCHWCHVMAHECFENDFIAEIMNEHFVCIKVDREERPDVDHVYMEAVQLIIQRGGWPLNVFCLPDGRPFFGGTYFPPEDQGNGLIPWPQLLIRISDFFKKSKEELMENAESIQKNLIASCATSDSESYFKIAHLSEAALGICGNHDDQYGGFGSAPKFPQAMNLNFLLSMRTHPQGSIELSDKIEAISDLTLKAMAHGGLYDQVGGGFSRYSVDAHWLIPHFEKMLYDNALLIGSYTRAWITSKNPLYASVIEETVAWLDREMLTESGAYASSLDADTEGVEGRFYVWDPEQIEQILGPSQGKEFNLAYGINSKGNFEDGFSVPALQDSDISVREKFAQARTSLLEYRDQSRARPARDPKIITAWNCMLASSLAEAGFYLNKKEWVERARSIVDFIWDKVIDHQQEGLQLSTVFYSNSDKRIKGFLNDYALLAEALLTVASKVDWVDYGASSLYIERAEACLSFTIENFKDEAYPGFYFTAKDQDTPIVRRKEWFDNAVPSGNAALLHALSGMCALTGSAEYESLFHRESAVYNYGAKTNASSIAFGLEAIANHEAIAVIRVNEASKIESARKSLLGHKWRRLFILSDANQDFQCCIGKLCLATQGSIEATLSDYS